MSYRAIYLLFSCGCLLLTAAVGCGSANSAPLANPTIVAELRDVGAAAAAAGPAAVVGEGWGALKGRFVYAGDPPVLPPLAGGKDPAVCDAHPLPDQSIVVDPATKGLANVVVYARKVSRVHDDAKKISEEKPVFDQKNCLFLSHVTTALVGQPMIVKNSDPIAHNSNITPAQGNSANFLLPGNGQAEYTFTAALADPTGIVCSIHPWMKAYVIPRKDLYVAVSKPDGTFEIPNLPAGEPIEFQVWHEKAPKFAAKPEWTAGKFKQTVTKDAGTDLGEISVSPDTLK